MLIIHYTSQGLLLLLPPLPRKSSLLFIVADSVASLAYCIAVGEGRPEVDCEAHNIVIVGKNYCYWQHNCIF